MALPTRHSFLFCDALGHIFKVKGLVLLHVSLWSVAGSC